MEFDDRQEKRQGKSDPAGQSGGRNEQARPPPESLANIGMSGPPDRLEPSEPVPAEVMSLIRRVAKYHARIDEGMIRYKDDTGKAIHYARQTPDGMTEEEHNHACSVIGQNAAWHDLLDQLMQAASDEVYEKHFSRRRPDE